MKKLFQGIFPGRKLLSSFLCYFTVALLSVFLNMLGYSTAIGTLENEISKNSQSTVDKLRIVGDDYLSDLRQAAYSLLSSEAVFRLCKDDITQQQSEIYTSMILRDAVTNSTKGYFGIFLKDKDVYIQNELGLCTSDMAWKTVFSDYESKDAWINDIFSQSGVRFAFTNDEYRGQLLRIIYYVPGIRKEAAAIATADINYIRQLISLDKASGEYVYLVTDNGIIMQSGKNSPMPGNTEAIIKNDKIRIDGKSYIVNRAKSEFDDIMYVRLTDYDNFASPIKKVRIRFIISFVLCLIIGAVIAYFLSRINLIKELRYMNETKEYRRHIEGEALRRLLTGRQSPGDDEYINNVIQRLDYGNYVLASFDFFEKVNGDIGEFDREYIDNLCDFIESKLMACSDSINIERTGADGNEIIIIASEHADREAVRSSIESIAEKLYDEFKVEMCCAISDFTNEFHNLNIQYNHCLEVHSASFLEDAGVLLYDRSDNVKSTISYSLSTEEQLMDFIRNGNAVAANNLINTVLSSESGHSIESGKILLSEVIATLVKTGEEIYGSDSSELNKMLHELSDYYSTTLYYRLRGNISNYVSALCSCSEKTASADAETDDKRCKKIKNYIEENYSDVNLNVNTVADFFNVSRSWLSTNFKKDYGVNISDFIVTCRINKAKELLATDMSVNDIAVNVGFTNKTVYCRAFKRYENITSGQYRELLRKKNS